MQVKNHYVNLDMKKILAEQKALFLGPNGKIINEVISSKLSPLRLIKKIDYLARTSSPELIKEIIKAWKNDFILDQEILKADNAGALPTRELNLSNRYESLANQDTLAIVSRNLKLKIDHLYPLLKSDQYNVLNKDLLACSPAVLMNKIEVLAPADGGKTSRSVTGIDEQVLSKKEILDAWAINKMAEQMLNPNFGNANHAKIYGAAGMTFMNAAGITQNIKALTHNAYLSISTTNHGYVFPKELLIAIDNAYDNALSISNTGDYTSGQAFGILMGLSIKNTPAIAENVVLKGKSAREIISQATDLIKSAPGAIKNSMHNFIKMPAIEKMLNAGEVLITLAYKGPAAWTPNASTLKGKMANGALYSGTLSATSALAKEDVDFTAVPIGAATGAGFALALDATTNIALSSARQLKPLKGLVSKGLTTLAGDVINIEDPDYLPIPPPTTKPEQPAQANHKTIK